MKKNHVLFISILSVICLISASFSMLGCGKSGNSSNVQEIPAATIDASPVPVVTPPMVEEMLPETEMSLDATPVVVPTVPADQGPLPVVVPAAPVVTPEVKKAQ